MTDKEKLNKISDIVCDYVNVDGDHHKQWALEEICRILNIKLDEYIGIPD